ncbi:MAG: BON domain-containing protein [Labilithrix sp.]|nr:BON domain-containing protein [Labilithrix sp.]
MRHRVRAALAFGAGIALLLLLDWRSSRRRGKRLTRGLLDLVRPRPISDATIEAHVHAKLERVASHPEAIHAAIEHGCVVLSGEVETHERAAIVKEVARARGVDSVVDIMTEHHGDAPAVPPALGHDVW